MSAFTAAPTLVERDLRSPSFEVPEYHICFQKDGTFKWTPPASSPELALTLSYHFPKHKSLEEMMQAAIRRFLRAIKKQTHQVQPDQVPSTEVEVTGIGKERVTHEMGHHSTVSSSGTKLLWNDLAKNIQLTNGLVAMRAVSSGESQLSGGLENIFDAVTGKEVPPTGKRAFTELEKVEIRKNRGKVCEEHHKKKKKCDPLICPQNKQYSNNELSGHGEFNDYSTTHNGWNQKNNGVELHPSQASADEFFLTRPERPTPDSMSSAGCTQTQDPLHPTPPDLVVTMTHDDSLGRLQHLTEFSGSKPVGKVVDNEKAQNPLTHIDENESPVEEWQSLSNGDSWPYGDSLPSFFEDEWSSLFNQPDAVQNKNASIEEDIPPQDEPISSHHEKPLTGVKTSSMSWPTEQSSNFEAPLKEVSGPSGSHNTPTDSPKLSNMRECTIKYRRVVPEDDAAHEEAVKAVRERISKLFTHYDWGVKAGNSHAFETAHSESDNRRPRGSISAEIDDLADTLKESQL